MEEVDRYIPDPVRALDRPFSMPVEDVFSIQARPRRPACLLTRRLVLIYRSRVCLLLVVSLRLAEPPCLGEAAAGGVQRLPPGLPANTRVRALPALPPCPDVCWAWRRFILADALSMRPGCMQGRGTVVTGRVEQGIVRTGDEVEIVGIRPANTKSTVTGAWQRRRPAQPILSSPAAWPLRERRWRLRPGAAAFLSTRIGLRMAAQFAARPPLCRSNSSSCRRGDV
jgi:hypothetical protein